MSRWLKYALGYLLLEVVDYSYWKILCDKQRKLRNFPAIGDAKQIYMVDLEFINYVKNLDNKQTSLLHSFLGTPETKSVALFHMFYKMLKEKRHECSSPYLKFINHHFKEIRGEEIKNDKNFKEIHNEEHIQDNKIVVIPNKIKHRGMSHIPILLRLLMTFRYLYFCYYLKSLGFTYHQSKTTTVWIRKTTGYNNGKNSKVVLIQHGLSGDLGDLIKLSEKIPSDYDVIIPVFFPVHLSYFQTTGNISDWISAVYEYCIEYDNLYVVCHSYGGNLWQCLYTYLKLKSKSHIVKKEILIESASFVTACIAGYCLLFNKFLPEYNKFNTYSTKKVFNLGLLHILYSSVGKFGFYASSAFRGCQYEPRDNQIALLSENDPIITTIKDSTLHFEIEMFMKGKNNQIHWRKGYHGGWMKRADDIVKMLTT
jgi:hypothetical protein